LEARYFSRALDVDGSPEGFNPDRLAPIRRTASGIVVQSSGSDRIFKRRFDSNSKSPDPHLSQHTPFYGSGCLIAVRVGGL
jgi:hypothetical protein